ncbi:multisubunit sodium/proton antiporter, MrpD subunit [Austwickia chelonae]|uniref:Na(+)/H(+) antiporter subunit D n=1 Tax=Austwickia chelonae NBRC 105200 TaxID=1184607 RepID=K6UN67_9MICO|nr:proton-conducting transporter membrane subunit [Austwickia chelonae]GAB78726.1 Na(+)/H(+) antiporter subunit D [Austwickia chelonae NBRC 105200]SEW35071.1 multisubunit sodium/proton antiporter, MrpD subunit [Austwickia chelonae]
MTAAALPLFVAVPLAAAALTVLWRQMWWERVLMVGVPLATAAGGLALIVEHRSVPVIAHGVGGYVAGIAIPFVSDTLAAAMLVITGVSTAASCWFLISTGEDRYRFVPALALMLGGGVNGALLTADLFNLFVFIEVMLLPSYALIAVSGSWRRLGIARLFILVNLVTSTFLLMGVGLVYGVGGTANLAALAGRAGQDPRIGAAVAVVLLALSIKGGVVPVHGWLPRAYPATSAGVMVLFSGLHTKVALYALYRIYSVTYGGRPAPWMWVFAAVVLVTVVVGSVSTIGERRIRSALAFQMVAGVGHILIGLVVMSTASLAAGLFYLAHHVVTMSALLMSAGAIEHTYGSGRYDRLNGLLHRDPVVAGAMVIGLFSLVGLPPTSGMWGKIGIVRSVAGATDREPLLAWTVIAVVVLASLASLLALQRLWDDVFWGKPMEQYRPDDQRTGRGELVPVPAGHRVPARLAAPGVFMTALSVGIFLAAGWLFPVAQDAASGLADIRLYVAEVLR